MNLHQQFYAVDRAFMALIKSCTEDDTQEARYRKLRELIDVYGPFAEAVRAEIARVKEAA